MSGAIQSENQNTPEVHTVQIHGQDYPIHVGEDTAKISLYLKWHEEKIFERLKKARMSAEQGDEEGATIDLGGMPWVALPYGMGGRKGMPYMGYRFSLLEAPDIILSLRDSNYKEKCINGMLDIGSLVLMCKGSLAKVWLEIKEILRKENAYVFRNVLSRADMAIDIGGYPVLPFVEKFRQNHVVGGGRCNTEYEGAFFSEGRSPTAVTCGRKGRGCCGCGFTTN
jgi:hypothetical protein